VTGRVGVAPWAGVLAGMFWITELVCEGMVAGEVLVKLQLLWGGVVLCWAWELDDLLASGGVAIGKVSVGGLGCAMVAAEWGGAAVGWGTIGDIHLHGG